MGSRRLIALLLVLGSAPLAAQEGAEIMPLGIALEEIPYPFTVHFPPLVLEGQDVRMAYMDVAPVGPANGRSVLLRAEVSGSHKPVRPEFAKIVARTLLVIGQADRTVVGASYMPEAARAGLGNYPELGRAAGRDIPGAKLVELPGVGHLPPLESPGPFRAAFLDFLAGGPGK